MQTLNEQDFLASRREPRLSYAIYLESKDSQDEGYDMVEAGLQQPAEVLQNIPPENFMTATRRYRITCGNGMRPAAASPITTAAGATRRSWATGHGKRPPSPACSVSTTSTIGTRPSIRPTWRHSAGDRGSAPKHDSPRRRHQSLSRHACHRRSCHWRNLSGNVFRCSGPRAMTAVQAGTCAPACKRRQNGAAGQRCSQP